jgi:hypothetical protein
MGFERPEDRGGSSLHPGYPDPGRDGRRDDRGGHHPYGNHRRLPQLTAGDIRQTLLFAAAAVDQAVLPLPASA